MPSHPRKIGSSSLNLFVQMWLSPETRFVCLSELEAGIEDLMPRNLPQVFQETLDHYQSISQDETILRAVTHHCGIFRLFMSNMVRTCRSKAVMNQDKGKRL